jgi:signal transduction histidine kinase
LLTSIREPRGRAEPEIAEECPVTDDYDDLLTTLNHELRAPLNAVLGWVQLLRASGDFEPKVAQALETIERNARLQASVVEEALDVMRISSGRLELSTSEVRWAESVRAAAAGSGYAAKKRGIQIELHVDREMRVYGDFGRLVQIAKAMIASAVRRSPDGTTVKIALSQDGDQGRLAVTEGRSETSSGSRARTLEKDSTLGAANGAPQPHELAVSDRVRSRSPRVGGSRGLGVLLAYALVRAQGGSLLEEDGGATLVARLPLARAIAPSSGASRAVA